VEKSYWKGIGEGGWQHDIDSTNPPTPGAQALETELAKLKAMIAAVVTKQEAAAPLAAYGAPPPPPPFPSLGVAGGPPGPPPPPPPPPPTGAFQLPKQHNIRDIINANRKGQGTELSKPAGPSMADVLKGLGSVKLKGIERSPGGTVLRAKNSGAEPAGMPTDPAAMIAMALKRKFAHRRKATEEDEEESWEEKENRFLRTKKNLSPKGKPDFGPHMLKNKRALAQQN